MNRKGITPVVATVLLIMISVGSVVSAYSFINDAQKKAQENFEDRLSGDEEAEINLEGAYNNTNYTTLSVRNTDDVTLPIKEDGEKIWSLYVNGVPTEWKFIDDEKKNKDFVAVNNSATVEINSTEDYPVEEEETAFKLTVQNGGSDSLICYHTGSDSC